jgi:hypothetical protein
MGFEQRRPEDELKLDIKQSILDLIHLKDYGKIEKEQIVAQLGFIKTHIEELVAIVGEEDPGVIELKDLFKRNFLAFPVEV